MTGILLTLLIAQQEIRAELQKYKLESNDILIVVTPDIGGRVIHLSRKNTPNLIKLGEVAESYDSNQPVNADSPFLPYFGHEIWFGPQSEWWLHQSLNTQRKIAKSEWPPDPFSSLLANKIISHTDSKIVMQSDKSPVTGLQVTKTFALATNDPRQIDLVVVAKNTREINVSWDIWFNTRSFPTTQIYAPVENSVVVEKRNWDLPKGVLLDYRIKQGLLFLDLKTAGLSEYQVKGKIMFQPSEGWYAAFGEGQLLIVQFEHQPKEMIHPEHGQLEYYLDFNSKEKKNGVLEMELHSAYTTLKPQTEMQSRERWTLIQYTGDASSEAQISFLQKQLKTLAKL